MDVDTLVRHNLPVVMIVGNNSAWGLEKGPMRAVYGYDVAADLRPGTRYDEVVRALGGAGELVTAPDGDRPGAPPGLRRCRPVPDQRDHRRLSRLPPHHDRRLAALALQRGPRRRAMWIGARCGEAAELAATTRKAATTTRKATSTTRKATSTTRISCCYPSRQEPASTLGVLTGGIRR